MKKIRLPNLLTLVLISVSFQAQAQLETNLLVGVSAGWGVRSETVSTQFDYWNPALPLPQGAFNTHVDSHLKDNGMIWGGLLGAQITCENWLLGIELSYDRHDFDEYGQGVFADQIGLQGWVMNTRYERGGVLSLSGRWGYLMTNTLRFYLRLGIETSEDTFKVKYVGVAGYPLTPSFMQEKRVYRALGGFGFEIPIMGDSIFARAEYNFHSEGQVLQAEGPSLDGAIDPYFVNRAGPNSHSGKVSVVWNFM